jgi:hypothetical protein
MTIADDMQAASRGEMAGLRAQLAGSQRALTKVMGELTEAREDVARFEAELDRAMCKLDAVTKQRDTWRRVALAYRCDRNEWANETCRSGSAAACTWSMNRRAARREEQQP